MHFCANISLVHAHRLLTFKLRTAFVGSVRKFCLTETSIPAFLTLSSKSSTVWNIKAYNHIMTKLWIFIFSIFCISFNFVLYITISQIKTRVVYLCSKFINRLRENKFWLQTPTNVEMDNWLQLPEKWPNSY